MEQPITIQSKDGKERWTVSCLQHLVFIDQELKADDTSFTVPIARLTHITLTAPKGEGKGGKLELAYSPEKGGHPYSYGITGPVDAMRALNRVLRDIWVEARQNKPKPQEQKAVET